MDRLERSSDQMDIQIKSSNISLSKELCSQVEQRFAGVLGKFSDLIRGATVHLEAVGTQGETFSLACRVVLELNPSGTLTAQAVDGNVDVAISRTARRIGRRLGRDMDYMKLHVTLS